eukprot:scaffold247441_cov34-Tisochrysis_lutea.AAC.1
MAASRAELASEALAGMIPTVCPRHCRIAARMGLGLSCLGEPLWAPLSRSVWQGGGWCLSPVSLTAPPTSKRQEGLNDLWSLARSVSRAFARGQCLGCVGAHPGGFPYWVLRSSTLAVKVKVAGHLSPVAGGRRELWVV